jgi:hypothetical protein
MTFLTSLRTTCATCKDCVTAVQHYPWADVDAQGEGGSLQAGPAAQVQVTKLQWTRTCSSHLHAATAQGIELALTP